MNREFLDYYQLELKQLYEKSRQFSEEYPGVARRLGGLIEDKMDPGIAGLLEGAAFMAARVQLKLKSEFSEFTSALLDQILPDYLAPIPSATLVAGRAGLQRQQPQGRAALSGRRPMSMPSMSSSSAASPAATGWRARSSCGRCIWRPPSTTRRRRRCRRSGWRSRPA